MIRLLRDRLRICADDHGFSYQSKPINRQPTTGNHNKERMAWCNCYTSFPLSPLSASASYGRISALSGLLRKTPVL
ncbi:hypothetical protein AAEO56_03175 [Flavobacterium sp. DGU11]|uniref:Transposase n=1 Tax=Flavobacterium arundinis TaxID=3139143 RepID=A0ABU9HT30_9FLAO